MSASRARRPSTLRHEAFRAIWIAAIFSYIGDWVQNVGQSWLMLSLTKSAVLVSMVTTCFTLPTVFLVVPSGVMADRWDRRKIIMVALAWQTVVALSLASATWFGFARPAFVLVAAAGLGIGTAITGPPWQSLVPELVPRDEIAEAVTLNSVAFNIARAVGPALGGLLISTLGTGAAFAVNAASFLAIIGVLWRYREIRVVSELRKGQDEPFFRAVASVLAHVRGARELRAVYLCVSLFALAAASVPALLPVFAKVTLGSDERGYGLLLGALGAGAILGALVLRRARSLASARAVIAAAFAMYGVFVVAMTFTHSLGLAATLLLPAGGAWIGSLSTLNALMQLSAPQRLKSRAIALYSLSFYFSWSAGASAGGAIASAFGAPVAIRVAAAGTLVVAAITTLLPLPAYTDTVVGEPDEPAGPISVR